ncbi:MAG: helix-turn-helix transcriptional regulator [Armatimonadetes bacterium]|nr:helix-turn-helix transcriptional regulator [Armatimonadota bacterium]
MDKAFAAVLRDLRTRAGLSQEELGELTDLHRTYISQLERCLKSPSLRTLTRLAAALGVSVSEMMMLAESRLPPATDTPTVPRSRSTRSR